MKQPADNSDTSSGTEDNRKKERPQKVVKRMPSTKMRNKIKQIGQRHTKWAQNWKLRAREKEAESLNKIIQRQRKKRS